MTDANKNPKNPKKHDKKPEPGPTKRLDKAIEDLGAGDTADGTLVDISAGTGEHPQPSGGDVDSELKKQKGAGGSQTPDIEPAATMYEPTQKGSVTGGSHDATMYEPTGTDQHRRPPSEQVQSPSGSGRPVAPFGGKIMVGTKIGQIEITGVLGKGGMGEVFKGYHQALDIDVALKVLPDELSRNELVRQRFLREARLCVKLDHPHIVRVYNVDEYAGNLYLVMEMIEGTDSAAMLKDGGRFRYKRALEIGAACADALAYAHTQGLVHRDVKPHNILLGARDSKIKLSDFGLARAATSSSHLTMSGQIMGTPHYMSPEQAESKEVTDKSDVYSLGVTLYHMLTGETPFVGDTPISVAVQHIAKEIIYPEIRFKPFPKELVAVLKRMTAKDPAKRCSAKQAAVWLRKLISMATDDDIKVDDDQAMKSMAPVVRESEAFQMAQKERQQRDHQAREAAQTMLATVQEHSGRRRSVTPAGHDTGGQAYQTQPQAKSAGGKIAAALIVLLLLGGGVAGWYFLMGPGKGTFGGGTVIADGDNGGDQDGQGKGDGPENNNTGTQTVGDDNDTHQGNQNDNGGNGDNNTTPPEEDDPTVAARLNAADEGISQATSLEEIMLAAKSLELAEMESHRASKEQLRKLEDLQETYARQFAYFEVDDAVARIDDILAQFREARLEDRKAAIELLNKAIAQRTRLDTLEVPPKAAELIEERRAAAVNRVNDALDDFWGEFQDEAQRLIEEEQFSEADKVLAEAEAIHAGEQKLGELGALRTRVQTLSQHKLILARLDSGQYNEAKSRLKELDGKGVPESLKEAHERVSHEVDERFEKVFGEFIDAADTALDESDFDSARDNLTRATALDLKPEQASKAADLLHVVAIRELIHDAGARVDRNEFTEAQEALAKADELIRNPGERKIPDTLPETYRDATMRFDAELERRFNELMDAAKTSMEEKNFSDAGKNLQMADELPLTDEQKAERKVFGQENANALADYVRDLITDLETALDAGEFATAGSTLETIRSLQEPADLRDALDRLETRFETESVARHEDLLAQAEKALEEREYPDARKALNAAARIPVADERAEKARQLDERCSRMLTVDVDKHLAGADDQLAEDNFSGAAREVNTALGLLTGSDDKELTRKAKLKLEAVAERLVARFDGLLKEASDARKAELLESSKELLKQAEDLLKQAEDVPVDEQELWTRLGKARDDHNQAEKDYLESLFAKLQDCVNAGDEEEGKKIAAKIRDLKPSPTYQSRLRRLEESLTGETSKQREERLPRHLRPYFRARNLSVEQHMDLGEEITAVNTSPDGEFAIVGTASGRIHFYNLRRGTKIGSSTGGRGEITAVAFAPDGTMAVSGNDDGKLVRYRIEGISVSTTDLASAGSEVKGLAFSSNGNMLYVATYGGDILRYNAGSGKSIGSTRSGLDRPECLTVSPDGNWLAIGGDRGRVALFNAETMVLSETLKAPEDETIQRVAFDSAGKQLIGGSIGDYVFRWDLRRAEPRQTYKGLDEWIHGAGFSEDGSRCAAFDDEYSIKVWGTGDGGLKHELSFEKLKGDKEFRVSAGVVGPDGTMLIGTRAGELIHLSVSNAGG